MINNRGKCVSVMLWGLFLVWFCFMCPFLVTLFWLLTDLILFWSYKELRIHKMVNCVSIHHMFCMWYQWILINRLHTTIMSWNRAGLDVSAGKTLLSKKVQNTIQKTRIKKSSEQIYPRVRKRLGQTIGAGTQAVTQPVKAIRNHATVIWEVQ